MKRTDSLYKYTRLEYVNSSLNNGIFASPIDTLNDPYEFKEMPANGKFRIVCLSRSRNAKLMWSHYADGHRGCSIKIAVPDGYQEVGYPLRRVAYRSCYLKRNGLTEDELAEALYGKDKKWSKELEVRAVYYANNDNLPCWKKNRNNIFYKANITQVDFGCFAHLDSHYLDALIAIRDYNANHRKKIKVRKYKMSDDRYEFCVDKTFDYIKEIAAIINQEE